jgi:hypothetical protein
MIPSEADIKKKEKQLQDFLKKLNSGGTSKEKDMVSVVRSAIRKSWMRSPTKLAYLTMHTKPDMDDTTRTKWKIQCECCQGWFKLNEVEVDHIWGNHSFTKVSDFENYFNNILMVGFDDLQILCKDGCHAIKSYAEKNGMTFEEASKMKIIIDLEKKKMLQDFIKSKGEKPASNAEKRREQALRLLKEEKENDI